MPQQTCFLGYLNLVQVKIQLKVQSAFKMQGRKCVLAPVE